MLTTDCLFSGDTPKVKEVINLTKQTQDKLIEIVPKEYTNDSGTASIIRGDIIVAGTLPSPDIEMIHNNGISRGRIHVLDKEDILAELKNSDDDKPFVIGIMEAEIDVAGTTKFQIALRMFPNLILDWTPIVKVPKKMYDLEDEYLIPIIESLCQLRDLYFLSWYGIQIALLNPVIKLRFKQETIPYENDSKKKTKSAKKAPKRYVKSITIGDISDLEFAPTKGHHQIKEPFWWVSGHWRNYKNGKRIFIQGYWKGVLREVAEEKANEPREREIVL